MLRPMGTALLTALVAAVSTGCYEDTGNYDYISEDEAVKVTLGPISDVRVKANEVLQITPQVSGDDNGHFSYLWYTLTDAKANVRRDTLSQERELNAPVNLKEGKYKLYYQVTNEDNGVYRAVSASLTVTATDITNGWYIMKQNADGADFDYFSLDGKITERDFMTKTLGMSPMQGTPVGIYFQEGTYASETENADGTTTKESGLSAFHIMTKNDYVTLNASDFSVLKTLDQQFYEKPEDISLDMMFVDLSMHDYGYDYCYLLNNGKFHSMGSEIGKWGYQAAGNYKLLPALVDTYFYIFGYDTANNEIVTYYDGVSCAQNFSGEDVTETRDSNLVVSALVPHIGGYSADFYLVAKSGNSGKNYVLNVSTFPPYVYRIDYYESPADSKLFSASIMAGSQTATVIYFADGNRLYTHRIATGEDRLAKTFAEGETIAYIKNITGTEADGTSFNDIVVITNTASSYNVYRFPMVGSAGELNTDKAPSFTGSGKAASLLFR